MSEADISVTGFTTIPFGDRVARPRGRRVRRSLLERAITALRVSRGHREAWNARVAAERAAAPQFPHPRDKFTVRHAEHEIRRF